MGESYKRNRSFVELLGSPRVFLHEITTLPGLTKLIAQVDGIQKYDRAIAIARPEDVILLKSRPEKSYLQWLEDVGLGSQKIIVLNGKNTETLPERVLNKDITQKLEALLGSTKNQAVLSPYYGGPLEKHASDWLGLFMYAEPDAVQRFDSKINFKQLCKKVGVPVVEFAIFDTRQGVHELVQLIKIMSSKTGKVIVRGEYGASASTTYVLDHLDLKLINEIVDSSKPGDRYLVEPFYKTLSSPSSVWFITKARTIVHLRTSNQLLEEGIIHVGNEFPVQFDEEQVNSYSFRIAKRLAEECFLGPFGIDYIETEKGIYATECNPRVTGAMYPWELVFILEKKGPIKAARAENIHLPRKGLTFEALRKLWKNVLYNGHNEEGVIVPFNAGPISEGKVTVLGTGSSKEKVDSLFKDIKSRLINLI